MLSRMEPGVSGDEVSVFLDQLETLGLSKGTNSRRDRIEKLHGYQTLQNVKVQRLIMRGSRHAAEMALSGNGERHTMYVRATPKELLVLEKAHIKA